MFTEVHQTGVFCTDIRDKVNTKCRFLCLEDETPETEDVLDDAVLRFLNILEHPDIHTDVVVDSNECFLDAVYFFIGHDDDVEEISIEADEKLEVCDEKENGSNDEYCSSQNFLICDP